MILTVEVACAKAVFSAPAELPRHTVGTELEVEKLGQSNVGVVC